MPWAQLVAVPDRMLEIARGNVEGMKAVTAFGLNGDIGTSEEDVWDGGGDWTAPTTARTHAVVSSSVNDTNGGTGARTVRLHGLTGWGAAEVSEDITMNGTTPVNTTNSYVMVNRLEVLTSGSAGPNDGTITATAATDSTVTARIAAGEGYSLAAIYGLPSVQNLYLKSWFSSLLKGPASANLDGLLLVNPEPGDQAANYHTRHKMVAVEEGNPSPGMVFDPPLKISGPAIVKIRAISDTASSLAAGGFSGILVTE